eukprot:GHVR01034171.1.p2 GENE.GHVR01034171.1~~GHVR01034171.1.p2  ORF type:complete len:123 (-),score=4.01 GHVR01034171.1:8961-9290(-)
MIDKFHQMNSSNMNSFQCYSCLQANTVPDFNFRMFGILTGGDCRVAGSQTNNLRLMFTIVPLCRCFNVINDYYFANEIDQHFLPVIFNIFDELLNILHSNPIHPLNIRR